MFFNEEWNEQSRKSDSTETGLDRRSSDANSREEQKEVYTQK